ncbi:hypothetical protein NDU88_002155 [Pleurodeles waltl]|uniref:Uncharacterized protein n=1 Tax=Pleurodeles waltl TaxID=8319 RepID=A0AAV7TM96_PLEWA|nr:hypothetical protein NDU88_002155 [Pleurodeles waltl]
MDCRQTHKGNETVSRSTSWFRKVMFEKAQTEEPELIHPHRGLVSESLERPGLMISESSSEPDAPSSQEENQFETHTEVCAHGPSDANSGHSAAYTETERRCVVIMSLSLNKVEEGCNGRPLSNVTLVCGRDHDPDAANALPLARGPEGYK